MINKLHLIKEKNYLILAVALFILCVVLSVFVYLPTKNEIKILKLDLADLNGQIAQIESILDETKPIKERIRLVEEKYRQLDLKFPRKEEKTLGMISQLAEGLDIKIYSILPSAKKEFLDENNQKIELSQKILKTIYISVKLEASYRELLKYMQRLQDQLPAHISFEGIVVRKKEGAAGKLDVTLNINLYLLS